MFLSYLTLFVALALSVVAAFYSIVGLTAIFAAAVVPIVIMGSILEIAKLVVTVWLHEYWHQCRRTMKAYLVPAVGGLMLLTSMGIFGFLSKAHLDQAVPSGDIAAKVALYDEKINAQKDNIKAARANLSQLDAAVNETMGRSTDERGAERAVQIRRAQAKDRAVLTREIETAQTTISKLQEERAPLAAEQRKVEAEVGPVKYIAALIYGDNPDNNLLEKSVRWVIILLVFVFDPLAIMMLLAATESFKWERGIVEPAAAETANPIKKEPPLSRESSVKIDDEADRAARANALLAEVEREPETEVFVEPEDTPTPYVADVGEKPTADELAKEEPSDLERPGDYVVHETTTHADDDHEDSIQKQAKYFWKLDHPTSTLKEQRRLLEAGKIDHLPWQDYANDPRIVHDAGFGRVLPPVANKGDMFIVTEHYPTQLYKFNGEKWILVDKNLIDHYAYNEAYIDFLIQQISSGNYDPDLLTDIERSQIETRLQQTQQ